MTEKNISRRWKNSKLIESVLRFYSKKWAQKTTCQGLDKDSQIRDRNEDQTDWRADQKN